MATIAFRTQANSKYIRKDENEKTGSLKSLSVISSYDVKVIRANITVVVEVALSQTS